MNGVYNRKLFIDTARPARQKLAKMGGIMASSSDLMQAAVPPVQPMAPAPISMPQQMPQPMMMAPVMPAQPMSMAAPAPMPAQPMVQQTPPPAPMPPVMMNNGGAINEQLRAYSQMGERMGREARKPVDVSKAPTVEQTEGTRGALGILAEMDSGAADAAIARYGSLEAAEKALSEKGQKIDDLAEKDTETAVKGTLDAAEVPNTTEGKQEFARQVFGMEDVSDIDEIDRRIVDVLQGSAVGKGADAFAIATLAGLDELKKTQLAKIKAASKGSQYTPERFRQRMLEAASKEILKDPDAYNVFSEDGTTVDPLRVAQEASKLVETLSMAQQMQTPSAQSSSSMPTISNEAEYNALPSGATFIQMQNGKPVQRMKP